MLIKTTPVCCSLIKLSAARLNYIRCTYLFSHFFDFEGVLCDKNCTMGTFGKDCKSFCECKNSALCDPATGNCLCPDGFTGDKCEKSCEKGFYGKDCKDKCACVNFDSCSVSTGVCNCEDGYKGSLCETRSKILFA